MQRHFCLCLCLFLTACGGSDAAISKSPPTPQKHRIDYQAQALQLASETIIADGHIDLPYRLHHIHEDGKPTPDLSSAGEEGEFDAARAKEGGLDAPFMSIYIPSKYQQEGGAKKLADKLIDSVEELVKTWPGDFALATNPEQIQANFKVGKVSLLMGMENGAGLEDQLENVAYFHKRGIRYITLTHATDNLICDSSYATTATWKGLSEYGAKVVAEMNRVGIMVDISHVSDRSFYDVLKITTKPVIASHSSMRHFTPGFERNMDDDMVRALAANGGLVMINFGSTFISQESRDWSERMKAGEDALRAKNKDIDHAAIEAYYAERAKESPFPYASVEDVANHIDHVVQLVGVDHVGFGSDFDGVGDTLPTNLKDASDYPKLIEVLLRRGYSDEDIRKIASGNLFRVWSAQANAN